jgi:hypothetical protein
MTRSARCALDDPAPSHPCHLLPPNAAKMSVVNSKLSRVVGANRLTAGTAITAVVALGFFIAFLWRAHDRSVAWGDVPTWLAVSAAVIGAAVALQQLNNQQKAIARQARALERQQADAVGFSWRPASPVEGAVADEPYKAVYMAVVENGSHRPIRDVECYIELDPAQPDEAVTYVIHEAVAVAELVDQVMPPNTQLFHSPQASGWVRVIGPGRKFGFKFPFPVEDHPNVRMKVWFTDDADLEWTIDHDLHLNAAYRPHGVMVKHPDGNEKWRAFPKREG